MRGLIGNRIYFRLNSNTYMAKNPDLELLLEDPSEARKYIAKFNWYPTTPPKYVVLSADEKIPLKGPMSDQEAVLVAKTILRDVEIPAVMREKQLAPWGISCWEH